MKWAKKKHTHTHSERNRTSNKQKRRERKIDWITSTTTTRRATAAARHQKYKTDYNCDETKPVHTALVCISPPLSSSMSIPLTLLLLLLLPSPSSWWQSVCRAVCLLSCINVATDVVWMLEKWTCLLLQMFLFLCVCACVFVATMTATISELYLLVGMPRKSCKSSERNQHVNHPWASICCCAWS